MHVCIARRSNGIKPKCREINVGTFSRSRYLISAKRLRRISTYVAFFYRLYIPVSGREIAADRARRRPPEPRKGLPTFDRVRRVVTLFWGHRVSMRARSQ